MAKKKDFSMFECLDEHIVPTGVLALDIVLGGGVERGDMVEFSSSSGVGKCVSPCTIVRTADGLRRVRDIVEPVKETPVNTEEPFVVPLVVNGQTVHSKGVYHGGISDVVTVCTESGGFLTGSYSHPVLLKTGEFKRLDQIKTGDELVIDLAQVETECDPKKYVVIDSVTDNNIITMTPELARAMGYVFSAGVKSGNTLYFNGSQFGDRASQYTDLVRSEVGKFSRIIATSSCSISFALLEESEYTMQSLLSFLLGEIAEVQCVEYRVPWYIWRSPYKVQAEWALGVMQASAMNELTGKRVYVLGKEIAMFCKQVLSAHGYHCKLESNTFNWYLTGIMLSETNVVYDPIVFVDKGRKSDVWDIVNSETSTFIADGFVVHNSTTLLQCCANKMIHGKKVAYLDIERGVKRSILNSMGLLSYAGSKIGDQFLVLSPITYSDVDDVLDAVMEAKYDMVILDSLSAVQPTALSDKDVEEATVGVKARLNSQLLCKYKPKLRMMGTNLWIVNQVRTKIGIGWGTVTTEDSTGGNAMYHYPDIRLRAAMGPKMKREEDTVNGRAEVVYGNMAKLWSVKNRNERPDIKVPLPVIYGKGVSNRLTVRDVLKTLGYMTGGSGGKFKLKVCEEEFVCTGGQGVLDWIQTNYEKVVTWMGDNGLLSIVHAGAKDDAPIEAIDSTVKVEGNTNEDEVEIPASTEE